MLLCPWLLVRLYEGAPPFIAEFALRWCCTGIGSICGGGSVRYACELVFALELKRGGTGAVEVDAEYS